MPQRVYCSVCGNLFYEGLELESPANIMQQYKGVCPGCGKRLSFNCDNIKLIPLEEWA